VSSLPALWGETIVLRLLRINQSQIMQNVDFRVVGELAMEIMRHLHFRFRARTQARVRRKRSLVVWFDNHF
jgi:hypothetical protein